MEKERQQSRTSQKRAKAARQKQRTNIVRRRLMVLAVVIVVAVVAIVLLICKGLGIFDKIPEASALTVGSDGTVICEEVSDFDEDFYDKSSLKTYIKKEIATFNESFGSGSVKLDKVNVKGTTAYVKVTYVSPAAYVGFTGYELYQGTIADALEAGYDFSDAFVSVSEGEKQDQAKTLDITAQPELKVVILKENIGVTVDGTILYVSDSNTTLVDESTVSIAQADGNEDATQLTYIIYE
jgi:hypothetical protein